MVGFVLVPPRRRCVGIRKWWWGGVGIGWRRVLPIFFLFLINYFLFYKWSLFILFEKVWRFLASFSLFLHFVDFSSFYFYLKSVQIL